MLKLAVGGVAMGLLHVGILAATVTAILSAPDRDWTWYWLLFLALDFPVSLGVIPLAWMFPPASGGPLSDFGNFWWPLAYHGLLGTFWWYVVGNAIAERYTGWRKSRSL